MKKILFVVESLAGGGAEKVLLTLVKNLDKTKYDITVFSVVKTGVYVDEIKKYCKLKFALNDYNQLNFIQKLLYRIKIRCIYHLNTKLIYKCLIKDKYDIEIAFVEGFDTKFVAASSNEKSKKYAWLHTDMIQNNHADIHYKNIETQKEVYSKYDHIFAVSNHVKDMFISKFKIKNVSVQYNPVDEYEILSKAHEKKINFDYNQLNLITIGRLEEQKGYDRLLRIVKKLKEEKYEFKLYILGDGSLRKQFETYIQENNLNEYVFLLGFQKNPYPYLKEADVFVCSSYSEGFSTVATESMILEVPIITTDCSGMKELFGEYECGIITNNNEESLYNGIKEVLENESMLDKYKTNMSIRKEKFKLEYRINELEDIFDGK